MDDPRPEKVAVVEEVRERLSTTDAVVFTEYRGLTVGDLQQLRTALRDAGGDYKVYKNTLMRRATAELDLDLGDTLTGPTALAFVGERPDGTPGDAVLVAKALKAFAKGNPNLVLKGGRLGEVLLDSAGVIALADVAPRDELLARLAGGMAAPMANFARLLQAVPQKLAYGLSALIEAGGAEGAPAAEAGAAAPEDTAPAPEDIAPAGDDPSPAGDDAATDEAAVAGALTDTDTERAEAAAGAEADETAEAAAGAEADETAEAAAGAEADEKE